MDRAVAFTTGPLEVRIREVLEGFDDRVTVILPHLHASMSDISWSIQAIDAFRDGLSALLAGQSAAATLDLAYSEGTYGLVVRITPAKDDAYTVWASIAPEILEPLVYTVSFEVARAVIDGVVPQLSTRLE